MRISLLCLSATLALGAQDLAAVKQALANLKREPAVGMQVRADLHSSFQGEKGAPSQSQAALKLDLLRDAHEMNVHWHQESLQMAQVEGQNRNDEDGQPSPTRRLMSELEPARLDHLLHQDTALLGILAHAKPVEETADTLEGRASRRLTFTYEPSVPFRIRKRVKEATGRLVLWVDAQGQPMRSEVVEHWSGRAGRIAPVERGDHVVKTVYGVVHGWLIAADRTTDDQEDDYYTRRATHLHVELQP
jgi:hypothetical protein